ncbi:cytochrome P450 [Pisolithus croceorrhizus]|nr:cytochrome P450 [Pisolithus croceorrhizus]
MDTASTPARIYNAFQVLVRSASLICVVAGLAAAWVISAAIRAIRKQSRTTKLRGPRRSSMLFGVSTELFRSSDTGSMFEAWAKEYGVAYEIPMLWGQKRIILCDPKAVAYFFSRDTRSYVGTPAHKATVARMIGKGLLWAEGESHRRQRRSMAPSFNSTAVRKLSPAIHKTVDKLKVAWQANVDASGSGSVVLDVQKCLDAFGIAGFSYDFDSLGGTPNSMISVLDAFAAPSSSYSFWDKSVLFLSNFFPFALNVPTSRGKMLDELRARMSEICELLIDKATKDQEGASNEQVPTIALLLKAEDEDSGQRITREERQLIQEQMRVLFIASYETTASTYYHSDIICPFVSKPSLLVTMTWALFELARHPDIQTKLREELLSFGGEPSYDQLSTGFPYLDAVVQETLRFRPAAQERVRQATEDDVIPLSEPVRTKSGEVVDSIAVERGTVIGISIPCMNRSEAIWGPDAKVFRPERWLESDGITKKAQEVKGHRHLLTFSDGPRTCIGKLFAVAEVKILLLVLVKNFVLEMRDGPDTKVEMTRGIKMRPKVAGEDGIKVPLRIKPYKG